MPHVDEEGREGDDTSRADPILYHPQHGAYYDSGRVVTTNNDICFLLSWILSLHFRPSSVADLVHVGPDPDPDSAK
jgi:hypothetical protein